MFERQRRFEVVVVVGGIDADPGEEEGDPVATLAGEGG
jgi:hypothetical protein